MDNNGDERRELLHKLAEARELGYNLPYDTEAMPTAQLRAIWNALWEAAQ